MTTTDQTPTPELFRLMVHASVDLYLKNTVITEGIQPLIEEAKRRLVDEGRVAEWTSDERFVSATVLPRDGGDIVEVLYEALAIRSAA